MMRFKIAVRNLLRNRRRTILNIIMIAGGFTAIVLFQGFAGKTLEEVTRVAINNQFGHLQVAKKNYWDQKANESAKSRAVENPNEILEKLKKIPGVEYASGRITFYGLLSAGDKTISAQFVGYDPLIEKRMNQSLQVTEGKNLASVDLSTNPVLGGIGLVKMINAKVGQDLAILSNTYEGAINAVDVKLEGIFVTSIVEIDDTTIYMPLSIAQKLLDTPSVDKIIVLLSQDNALKEIKSQVSSIDPETLGTKEWTELAVLFSQVEEFYSVQNMIIELIILLLVLLSISNTVGMSIFERTGEIGTLRALGDKSSDIIKSFCLEGLILGLIGSLVGVVLAMISSQLINYLAIPITIPGASIPIPVLIAFLPKVYCITALLLAITAIVATYFPSAKIAGMNIVEALRHNI